jgi:isoleucyl-tRNA synthetase
MVSFPLVDDPGVSMVAWTTTPWTLPSNLALCVHPKLIYAKVKGISVSKRFCFANVSSKAQNPSQALLFESVYVCRLCEREAVDTDGVEAGGFVQERRRV